MNLSEDSLEKAIAAQGSPKSCQALYIGMAASHSSPGGPSEFDIKMQATKAMANRSGAKPFSQKVTPPDVATLEGTLIAFGTKLARTWRAIARRPKLIGKQGMRAPLQ